MKKNYIAPAIKNLNTETISMMATSPSSISHSGSNKNGGPKEADVREEASFSSDPDLWNEEW